VSGIEIRLFQTDGAATQTVTDQDGRFLFSSLAPGAYRLVAEKSGYFGVERQFNLKTSIVADVILSPKAPLEDSVTVASRPDGVELKDARPSFRETITKEQLDLLPTGNSRNFLSGLSVSSSVVKDREGKLHIRGARSQSIQYLVDGVNVTDPVTGNLRATISSESIDSVDVVASGYAPEYGQSSGGLVRVETAVIPSKWKWSATDVIPNYSFRNHAFAEFSPRLTAQGPVRRSRLSLMYSLSGEYRNSFNEDLPRGENAQGQRGADHLIKARYTFSDLHLATATLLLGQHRRTNMGLTSQSPAETTQDSTFHQYIMAIRDRLFFDANTALESSFQVTLGAQETFAKGTALYRHWPNRRLGNHNMDEISRSRRFQWNEYFSWSVETGSVLHKLKTGTDVAGSVYRPLFALRPVEFRRLDDTLLRRTSYEGGNFKPSAIRETGFFIQDTMTILRSLTLTYGSRVDWDDLTRENNIGPRAGFTWYPRGSDRTRISGAIGYFYDHLLLTTLIQDQFPQRIESIYGEDGSTVVKTDTIKRVPPHRLQIPLSRNWEIGIERQLALNWILRSTYLRRSGFRELQQIDVAPISLRNQEIWQAVTNTGASSYNSFDISAEKAWNNIRFSASYTRSSAKQSLQVDPFVLNIRENVYEVAPSDWDTPHRFNGWTMFPFLKKSRAGVVVEARSGFPFSVRDDVNGIIGERNSHRFPAYFSLGFSLEREFPFTRKYRLGVRLSGFNLTNHFNPAFVDSNLTSPDFLHFGNSSRPSGNIRLRLIKRQ
jgi:outer membrane receptor for ferrienterochelin and colicin